MDENLKSAEADSKNTLEDLAEYIRQIRVVQCGLRHELVTGHHIACYDASGKEPELGYERTGFCAASVRRQRLGCAHTSCNAQLIHYLKASASDHPDFAGLAAELNQIFAAIYALDVAMGALEKQVYHTPADLQQELLQQKASIVHQHTLHLSKLKSIQEQLLLLL